jgi:hypothetical protein
MQENTTEVPSEAVSRRRFLGTAAATGVGLGLGSGVLTPTMAAADSGGSAVLPRPIPSGFLTPVGVFIHHHLPGARDRGLADHRLQGHHRPGPADRYRDGPAPRHQ